MTVPAIHGGITVTVQRATFDRFNDATYVDHHEVAGCLEYPDASTELNAAVTDTRTLLAPLGSDIKHTDRVRYPTGNVYQVSGLPKEWVNPLTGWAPGMQVSLERVS